MKLNQLGKSELHLSELGFGCMSLQGEPGLDTKLIHQALDQGINFFDTADLYQKGENEKLLGKALSGRRDDVLISSKVGNQWRADGSGWDWNPTREYILSAVESSLKRLGTDYLDLYLLHGGTIEDPIDDTIQAFETLVEQGKIRYYGISSIRPNVIREYLRKSRISAVMMQYSLLDRRPEEESLDLLHDHKIGVLARGTLGKGLLINKPPEPYLNWEAETVEEITRKMDMLGEWTRTQIALRYVTRHPAVTSAVVGVRTADQLSSLLNDPLPELSDDQYSRLKETVPLARYSQHR